MAIGTLAAIGLGLGAVGSAASGIAANNASKRAAQQSQQATDASLGLQRESRDMAFQRLDPFVNRGNAAGNAINALLGLGGAQMSGGGPATDTMWNTYLQQNPDVMQGFGQQQTYKTPGEFAQFHYNTYGRNEGRALPAEATPQGAQSAAENAFNTFRNSTGYKFRVGEGMDALNSGYAGSGLVQSGAALKGLDDYRQNMASGEFGNYMAYLGQQQGTGLGAASATAGVGQNFANNAGALIMNNADNQANAAIMRAQNNPFANFAGVLGGGLLGYGRR